ncbi:GGDEF domain-containing protein [Rossellomorea vietnamensis]|uniref:GGDEF domain-containing protein n=1 Tax=Rossellomorea vietnamensis TaxID=218284 RepID=A0A5D4KBJ5_9BACI|nr:GGDEF domain-containing protein [Rossellomorea vietnamensis]TYR74688.1 GGDEF domain-containing protein [Rossellomorea vietnamensis]
MSGKGSDIMRYTGRISSILIVMLIQTSYVIYYFHRDGFVDIVGWLAYPVLLLISYWTGFQYDKANYYSERDPLTNLYNRRFMIRRFNKYIKIADSRKKKLFVLLIDCNRFKQINDEYGHAAGDRVLVEIGKVLNRKRRNVFGSARWGGDEFIVLGFCDDAEELKRIQLELKRELSVIRITEGGSSIAVSIGSALQEGTTSIHDLLQQADAVMYQEKRSM